MGGERDEAFSARGGKSVAMGLNDSVGRPACPACGLSAGRSVCGLVAFFWGGSPHRTAKCALPPCSPGG